MRVHALVAALVGALAVLVAACGPAGDEAAAAAPRGEVVVFAAASLTDAFTDVAAAFEEAHPDLAVATNFAGSNQLAAQITQGAPADVLASADQRQTEVVVDAGLAGGTPEPFAATTLAVAVEPGNPLGIRELSDLTDPAVTLVLAAPDVPAGRYAAQVLAAAGVQVAPASEETDVRAVLAKVALGEADAGIVYRSDVVAAGDDVQGVPIPAEANVTVTYPIVTLAEAPNPAGARAFVDFVRSEAGRAVLAEHGFTTP